MHFVKVVIIIIEEIKGSITILYSVNIHAYNRISTKIKLGSKYSLFPSFIVEQCVKTLDIYIPIIIL